MNYLGLQDAVGETENVSLNIMWPLKRPFFLVVCVNFFLRNKKFGWPLRVVFGSLSFSPTENVSSWVSLQFSG